MPPELPLVSEPGRAYSRNMPAGKARWNGPWRAEVRPPDPTRAAPGRTAAVVLAMVLTLPAMVGCEYTYEDAWSPPEAAATTAPTAAEPQARRRGPPAIAAEEMQAWVQEIMPDASGEVVYRSLARLEEGEVRLEDTGLLVPGTYSLTLACRSVRRVDFQVRNAGSALIDLRLLCGPARVNVIQLPAEAVLSLRVHADEDANVAYRLILL